LPLGLVLLVAAGLGSHYETNDDLSITLLLRGRTAAAPVSDLHLYFHGWATVLVSLYRQWPALPWYGLLLYALLLLALVLLSAVLNRLLRPHLAPRKRTAWLLLFLLLAGLEHVQWFNYMRVPLLLAGGAVLFGALPGAPQRAGRQQLVLLLITGAAFGAAWAIRPSAALLGAAAVAPVAVWLGGRHGWRTVGLVTLLAVIGGASLTLLRTPEAARYRRLDVLKSNLNDYQLTHPQPRSAADSLGVQAVQHWLLGDSALVNDALFARALPFDARFLTRTAPAKLRQTITQLPRDYFPLLLSWAGMLLLGWRSAPARQRWAWGLYLLGVLGALLVLGAGLKLPPRLAGPLLTLVTLAQAALLLRTHARPWRRRLLWAVRLAYVIGAFVVALYGYKVLHRRTVLAREQARHEQLLGEVQRQVAGRVLVGAGVESVFKSLSPFRQYVPATGAPWLLLTGWTALDPSQAQLRQRLTGHREQVPALRTLLARPGAQLVLVEPDSLGPFMQRYLRERVQPPQRVTNAVFLKT
jgi:hypothetical protein